MTTPSQIVTAKEMEIWKSVFALPPHTANICLPSDSVTRWVDTIEQAVDILRDIDGKSSDPVATCKKMQAFLTAFDAPGGQAT